jgi:hypothetical protein
MIHSRIIAQYNNYCAATTNGDFAPLSETVLYSILRKCPAAVRKSLSGLDNISADGSAAFDELALICDQLLSFGKLSSSVLILYSAIRIRSRRVVRAYRDGEETSSSISQLPEA